MEFRFIDDGTRMDVQQMDVENAPMYYGIFVKMDKGVDFLLSCDPLHERYDELDFNTIYTLTFFRGAEAYTFEARITGKEMHFYTPALRFTATTVIKAFSRRNSPRIRVQMNINLYERLKDNPEKNGNLICTGVMHDVSRGGLTFLSGDSIPLKMRHSYIAEFSVTDILFRLPVEFVRIGEQLLSPLYRYDYAFMYNRDEDINETLNKLTLILFQQQLKNGR